MAVPLVELTRSGSPPEVITSPPAPQTRVAQGQGAGGPDTCSSRDDARAGAAHVCEEARCPTSASAGTQGGHLHDPGRRCTRMHLLRGGARHAEGVRPVEPVRLAEAVERMGLAHVVITSVDRDDLPNGGAEARRMRHRDPAPTARHHGRGADPRLQGLGAALGDRDGCPAGHPQPQPRDRRAAVPPGPSRRALRPGARAAGQRAADGARRRSPRRGIILGMGEEWDECWSACGTSGGAT